MFTEGIKYGKCTDPFTGKERIVTDNMKEDLKLLLEEYLDESIEEAMNSADSWIVYLSFFSSPFEFFSSMSLWLFIRISKRSVRI